MRSMLIFSTLFFNTTLLYSEEFSSANFSERSILKMVTNPNEIILTIDDGPTPGVTEKVLDTLKKYNLKATFFIIGAKAVAHPELVQRIVDEGHSVGNHTMNHLSLHPSKIDGDWEKVVESEILDADKVLAPYMEINNRFPYFRAPGGAWATKYADFLNSHPFAINYKGPIYWNIGGEISRNEDGSLKSAADWDCWGHSISPETCAEGYVSEAIAQKGGVLLMHDRLIQSAEMLEVLIPKLQDKNFTFSTLNNVEWN